MRHPPEPRLLRPPGRVRSFYGEETYARLVAVKERRDARNVFRHNRNVEAGAVSRAA